MVCIKVTTLILGLLDTNCYIVNADGNEQAVIIDPAYDADFILSKCDKLHVKPVALLITHNHFDHVLAADEIRRRLRIPLYAGEGNQIESECSADGWLISGDTVDEAGFELRVIETPGHTVDGICYYQPEAGVLFCGDTVFRESFAWTDIPGGRFTDLAKSITQRIFSLPDDTLIYPGHGSCTTIGFEKRFNPIFQQLLLRGD
jgi:glyoxylase-like metal-dependent hydrolase (beta-lactamase superfamily II)